MVYKLAFNLFRVFLVGLTGPVLVFFFKPHSNKELNHELDKQVQQPLHMSITRQVAVCMTAVPKPLSSRQQVAEQQLSQGRGTADN